MPQDRSRSAVYRSFLTCNDPKGVVECKRIRKSKNGLPKMDENLIIKQTTRTNVNVSSSKKEREDELMEVSRDLFKGARDLQESLEMLEKLQEASGVMAQLNKPKERNEKGKFSGEGVERTKSERILGDEKWKMEFRKPRHSIDGASWDCYEELREVIRDSFGRQNLLRRNYTVQKGNMDFSPDVNSTSSSQSSFEKACFDRRRLLSSPDLPSTSSSQSSAFQSLESSSFDSSLPKVRQIKPKAPNLIAKLMGLEEIPSQKQLEKGGLSHQRRPSFEIDFFGTYDRGWERRDLNPSLLSRKGFSSPVSYTMNPTFEIDLPKAKKPPFVFENVDQKQRNVEEIIGAMQFKGLLKSTCNDESMHGFHQPIVSDLENKVAHCSPIVIMKPHYSPDQQEEMLYSRTYPCEENAMDPIEMPAKWKRKEFTPETTGHPKGAPNMKKEEKNKANKSMHGRGAKEHGEALASPNDNKRTSPTKPRLEKKEVIERRVDKIQKIAPNTSKEEMRNAKFREAAKPQDLEKMASVKLRKQEIAPNLSQKRVTRQKSMTSDLTLNNAAASHNSRNNKYMKKTDKPIRNSSVSIVENLGGMKARTDLKAKKETDKTENKAEVSEIFHLEEVFDVSQTLIIDDHTQYCISPISNPEANTTKNLLLSSTSFLSHAKDLLDTYTWQPVELNPIISHDEVPETKLLLDCANELLDNKILQTKLSFDLLPKTIPISLDKLVPEICDEIETLRSYKDLTATISADTLCSLVERDFWCNGAASGAWDLGWRKGFTRDEVEYVVADMEKLILSDILDDGFADFVH